MNTYRTHYCNQLRQSDENNKVVISGWINRKRDHGNVLFVDLRDHYGVTQCVIEKTNKPLLDTIDSLRSESVIKVMGTVVRRSDDNLERRKRCFDLASKKGVDPIQLALAFVLNQEFPSFPLIGPRNFFETESSLNASKISLTSDEMSWLNLK